jgi:hypothetical protein
MYNSLQKLSQLIDEVGIEIALETIDINDVDDPTVKVILRTIKYSIARLREELN